MAVPHKIVNKFKAKYQHLLDFFLNLLQEFQVTKDLRIKAKEELLIKEIVLNR